MSEMPDWMQRREEPKPVPEPVHAPVKESSTGIVKLGVDLKQRMIIMDFVEDIRIMRLTYQQAVRVATIILMKATELESSAVSGNGRPQE